MPGKTIRGIGASAGIAIGPIFRYATQTLLVEQRHVDDVETEIARLDAALERARQDIHALFTQAQQDVGSSNAAIFEAHEMFLNDPDLLQYVRTMIETEHVNAEYAWQQGTEYYASMLRGIGDEYLAARAADIGDVAQRVLRLLQGAGQETTQLASPAVIVATELTPSDTVTIEKKKVLAFCTVRGGPTSHVAILSKALGIPAVVGLGEEISQLPAGTQVIVDGITGEVLVEPDAAIVAGYQQQASLRFQAQKVAFEAAHQPAITRDGKQVEVVANIGATEEAIGATEYGAEGIGLLRTEFLFLKRDVPPDEDEQAAIYQAVMEAMGQRPVVVRTLDIGGDKPAPYLNVPGEMNPFLGVRGVRLSLAYPSLFQSQLRALLRAGNGHNLKIMFPMVATRDEVYAVREQIEQARAALEERGVGYARQVEVGIMVEVPSAALMADVLAEIVDFFSIGTNDLAQYTLAADRTNPAVSNLADALHPAALRLIRMVIEAAHAHGRWVGLCGELAGDPLAAPVLLGLGLDEFSMTARAIPVVKQVIRQYSIPQAREIAERTLKLGSATEVRTYLESRVGEESLKLT